MTENQCNADFCNLQQRLLEIVIIMYPHFPDGDQTQVRMLDKRFVTVSSILSLAAGNIR